MPGFFSRVVADTLRADASSLGAQSLEQASAAQTVGPSPELSYETISEVPATFLRGIVDRDASTRPAEEQTAVEQNQRGPNMLTVPKPLPREPAPRDSSETAERAWSLAPAPEPEPHPDYEPQPEPIDSSDKASTVDAFQTDEPESREQPDLRERPSARVQHLAAVQSRRPARLAPMTAPITAERIEPQFQLPPQPSTITESAAFQNTAASTKKPFAQAAERPRAAPSDQGEIGDRRDTSSGTLGASFERGKPRTDATIAAGSRDPSVQIERIDVYVAAPQPTPVAAVGTVPSSHEVSRLYMRRL